MRVLRLISVGALLIMANGLLAEDGLLPKVKMLPKSGDKVEMTGKVATGIMAIGGETTGTTLTVGEGKVFELDLHGDNELTKAAEALNGKQAVATGVLTIKAGVEIGERKIIKVETLVATPAPK